MHRVPAWTLSLVLALAVPAISSADEPREGEIDVALFKKVFSKTPAQVIELVGQPAGRYVHDGDEHWLYDNAIREFEGKRKCPELLFRKGKSFQINWILEETMKKSVLVVKGFGDWTPPAEVAEKAFIMTDTRLVGVEKDQVLEKLGPPDAKRPYDGRELWEYRKVPLSRKDPQLLTLYLEFEGDKVTSSVGN